ncbi:MAG: transglycosylase domain-containing protein [Deltaproteobacteria bacterium]|nr:transglycosylase domain-containing protein [Deltaproteobacteria bacterium]
MSRILKILRFSQISLIFMGSVLLFAGFGMLGVVAWHVFYGDNTELQKSTILSRIQEETTLYYLDEETPIGSIFESRHRRYIPVDEIPAHMINAIVAAEDKNFYQHVGVDPFAIAKAAAEGLLRGGRFARGGSTLTQQTVKNIINDWEASFARKFREMIKALQIERMYSKRQILEFYLNQFHVAGNGNGIGIAARYYFNKEVSDLSLVEAAFIAGSVKGPGKYNPFIKFSRQARDQAKIYAHERKNYVLDRMYEQGWIPEQEYREAIESKIPFNRGEFRTAEVALVELVRDQLEKPEVLDALGLKDPEDLNVSGFRVYTTIDASMQKSAQFAMRKNLSRLETILSGFRPESPDKFRLRRELKKDAFLYGKVEKIEGNSIKDYQIHVSFGLPVGVISNASLARYARLLDLAVAKGYEYYMKEIIHQIRPGDILFVQVKEYDHKKNEAILELQKRPVISGGMIALDKGEVRAVVSGFDPHGFNRAMHAKRQAGSLFKALVYFAALQMGWTVLDRVENVRQLFPYQGKFYYPRPDHMSPYENVSMLWSGIMSENIASVALGARLLDKLSFEQFKKLMGTLGLMPQTGENPRDYHYRIARKIGVSLDHDGMKARQLVNATEALAPDLIFSGNQTALSQLRRMWLGRGYLAESRELRQVDPSEVPESETKIRLKLLLNNYERMGKLYEELKKDWEIVEESVHTIGWNRLFSHERLSAILSRFRVLSSGGVMPELGYLPLLPDEAEFADINGISLLEQEGRPLNLLDIQAIWGHSYEEHGVGGGVLSVEQVKLAGYLSAETFESLRNLVQQQMDQVLLVQDSYQLNRYYEHFDFRIGLGLHYLVELSRAAGVYSKLEPVLSFPLGSNDVTASEVAKLYQTFISGKTYRFYREGPDNQINFIRRIEDRNGKVLFEPKAMEHQLVDPVFAIQMREILRKVITHGTGRWARGELYVTLPPSAQMEEETQQKDDQPLRVRIPCFGKTGTTNDYLTSYFAGFIPYPVSWGKPLDPENSYIISSYVGYDFNRVMRRGRQRIYGGLGALPMWADFGRQILESQSYVDMMDPLDLNVLANKEWPLRPAVDGHIAPWLVDLPRGLILRTSRQQDVEVWNTTDIETTGETWQNLFAPGTSVKSVVMLPGQNDGNSWKISRLFGPFSEPNLKDAVEQDDETGLSGEQSKFRMISKASQIGERYEAQQQDGEKPRDKPDLIDDEEIDFGDADL